MRSIFLISLLLITNSVYAQDAYEQLGTKSAKAKEYYIQGDYMYVRKAYPQAIEWFAKAIKKDKNFIEAYYRKGSSHYKLFDTLRAQMDWEKAREVAGNAPEHVYLYYYLGKLYFDTGNYGASVKMLRDASAIPQGQYRDRIERQLEQSVFAEKCVANPLEYNPAVMLDPLNRFAMQYFPVFPADLSELVFTRRMGWSPNDDEDIFVSKYEDGWQSPESISENINTAGNEGTCSISGDGRTLIFTSCLGREGFGSCDLFISRKTGDVWSEPENLGRAINSGSWDSQPSLSADGRTLFFVSDRRGGEGRRDIWVSQMDEQGNWQKAENAGNKINTADDEVSPFIHVNNERLYFASRGHVGMGGFDLFYSDRDAESWTTPVNMGYPLNTRADQVSLVITPTGEKGFYSQDVTIRGNKRSLLYTITIPETHRPENTSYHLAGTITDAETGSPLEAVVELKDLESDRQLLRVASDSVTGKYLMVITQGTSYGLHVTRKGYVFRSMLFEGVYEDATQDVVLDPIRKDAVTTLNNIFFEVNSSELDQKSMIEIEEVVAFLKENPSVFISIEGHTDNQGTAVYNQTLSEARARAVYEAIITGGIDQGRLQYKGFGLSAPVADNSTETGRSRNRRITFRIAEL